MGLVDGLLKLVVLDDDGFDRETRLDFDLIERVQIRRISNTDE